MKIQKLILHNIASIEDAEIDFEKKPLADSPLFLICGETGAGKTTLLDAICLALYNDAPRINKSSAESYLLQKEDEADSVKSKDVRQLMRRNTIDASAIVYFIGNNGIHYEAKWSVARAYKRLTGNLKSVEWSWSRNGTLLGKRGEIERECREAIGLTFNQFCRTTMLAQGEFSKFLFAEQKEKAEILEKLTNTERFSKIGARIFEMAREKRELFEKAKSELEGIELLDKEAIHAILTGIEENMCRIKELDASKQTLLTKKNWMEKRADLETKSQEATRSLEAIREQTQSDAFRQSEQLLNDWNVTVDARNTYRSLLNNRAALKDTETKILKLGETFQRLSGNESWLIENIGERQKEWEEKQQFIRQQEPNRPMFEQEQTIVVNLNNYLRYEKDSDETGKSLSMEDAKQPQLEKEVKEKADALKKADELNRSKQTEIDRKGADLQAMGRPALEEQRQSLNDRLQHLEKSANAFELWEEKEKNLKKEKDEWSELDRQQKESVTKEATLKQLVQQKQQDYEQARDAYEKSRESVSDYSKELRHKLHAGDRCPVCGKPVTEILKDEHFQSLLEPIERHCKLLEAQYSEVATSYKSIRSLLAQLQKQSERQQLTVKDAGEKVTAAREKLQTLCRQCDVDAEEKVKEQIAEKRRAAEGMLEQLKQKIGACDTLQGEINALQKEKNGLEKAYNSAVKQSNDAKASLEENRKRADHYRSVIKLLEENRRLSVQTVQKLIRYPDWLSVFQTEREAFIGRLQKAAKTYHDAVQREQELQNALTNARNSVALIQEAKESILKNMPEWKDRSSVATTAEPRIVTLWNALNAEVATSVSHRCRATESIATDSKQLQQFYADHPAISEQRVAELCNGRVEEMEKIKAAAEQLRDRQAKQQGIVDNLKQEIETHLTTRPDLQEEDTAQKLNEAISSMEEQKERINQNVGSSRQQLKQDEQNKVRFAEKKNRLDRCEKQKERWETFCNKFGDKEGAKFRAIAQGYVLKEMLLSANHYLRQLNNRYTLTCSGLTLLVCDSFLGDALRPVNSLSGGESFLLSLALALGLSNLSNRQLSVEMLFIDEGFGTLSDDYLNTVMNALEKLNCYGHRKVGIISHVTNLRERIQTHIEVIRDGQKASVVRVVG